MKIVFDISELESFSIKNTNIYDYSLHLKLELGAYQLSSEENSLSGLLKNYFNKKDNFFYSYVTIESNGTSSKVQFQQHGIELKIQMNEDKLLKLYDELSKKDFKHRLLRIELSDEEMKNFPSREDIEDGVVDFIQFEKYSFEFSIDQTFDIS